MYNNNDIYKKIAYRKTVIAYMSNLLTFLITIIKVYSNAQKYFTNSQGKCVFKDNPADLFMRKFTPLDCAKCTI